MSAHPEHILVGVAWPYANGLQHIGHIAGAYLPPDIYARYQRMAGNKVLMVSGSDAHGTPITIKADEEGITAAEVVARYHAKFVESYLKLGLTFDLFTHTDTQNHWDTTQEFFRTHREKGFIYTDTQQQLFDTAANRFLPDRYVEGTCPKCGATDARGDQCDTCGATYEAIELRNPRSKVSGSTQLEVRDTVHFFFDLAKVNDALLEWIKVGKDHWRPNVRNFTKGQLEQKILRGRPITRDMTWGITIPEPGYDDKRIYVWYDAVIGYFSASKEWSTLAGAPDAWKQWWDPATNAAAKSLYFIGKDNIPFHTIIWPGMLWSHGGMNLPYDVPANEYLNMKGRKFSKSRGNIVAILDVLERYQPDAWRFALTAIGPEGGDVDFTWDDFVERVNGELVKNWGNLANRMLSFAFKRFEGRVPTPGELTDADRTLLEDIKHGFETVGAHFAAVRLRAAVAELLRLSSRGNQYITEQAPFTVIKTDPARAATIAYVTLQAIDWLRLLWAPILPHSSQKLHELLGHEGQLFGRQYTENARDARGEHLVLRYDHAGAVGTWKPATLEPGQPLREPATLFEMLDAKAVLEREAGAEG